MRTIEITGEAFQAASRLIPADTPLVMINLLRYRGLADYGTRTGVTSCSGQEAYRQRYLPGALNVVRAHGGRVFWASHVLAGVIGPPDERWDDALLVEYPSVDCLPRIYADPAYQAVAFHRTAALEDSRLIATATATDFG
jgi:uncharacterized protein (DUF1330 family)